MGEQGGNRIFSRVRVGVEPVRAGVKRCRIVTEVLRVTPQGMSDGVMEIACGLHALRVSCRPPWPALDVLSWVNSTETR